MIFMENGIIQFPLICELYLMTIPKLVEFSEFPDFRVFFVKKAL